MDQEQKPREQSFISELVPDWRPTRGQVLWAIRITVVLVMVLGILTLIGLPFGITLWEWVKLLIVPAVIAGGGIWFNRQQRTRELEIAKQRFQDETLQAYLEQMGHLLLEKGLRNSQEEDEVRMLARLDPDRKGSVLRFLYETNLISKGDPLVKLSGLSILGSISGAADLRGVDLAFAFMGGADLSGTLMTGANLAFCHLPGADLREADLSEATLTGVNPFHRTAP